MTTFTFSKEYKYFIIPLILIFITWGAIPPYEFPGEKFLGPVAVIAALFLWYRVFTAPYKIIVHGDQMIIFFSFYKKTTILPKNISSIKDYMGAILIKHSNGRIFVSSLMDNISGFRSTLLTLRPDLKIEDLANKKFDPKRPNS